MAIKLNRFLEAVDCLEVMDLLEVKDGFEVRVCFDPEISSPNSIDGCLEISISKIYFHRMYFVHQKS